MNKNSSFIWISLAFPLTSFLFQDSIHIVFSRHVPLMSSRLCQFLSFSLPSSWPFWRALVWDIAEGPSIWIFWYFLMIKMSLWITRKNSRGKVPRATCQETWHCLLLMMLTLATWLRLHLPDFSSRRLLFLYLNWINIWEGIFWDYAKILVLLKLSSSNIIIH